MPAGRPPIFETPEQMEAAIEEYFNPIIYGPENKCSIEPVPIGTEPRQRVTITGLAYHLGFCDRQSLYDYETKEKFSCIVKRARLRVEMSYEERLAENSCTGAIFALKNMGWRDKTEVDNNVNIVNWEEIKTYAP
jgi:hypothetical protein